MSPSPQAPAPLRPIIDVHVIVRDGDKLLLSRRAGAYGHGRWHAP
ncbi:hypothetical protein [Streptomyces sp. NBC_00102]|nr:hypothetical protein [Streptomyces sp. NBC_00102]MCX5396267.1 hypothetical protein [Streptomyces sp. NBC_00102]